MIKSIQKMLTKEQLKKDTILEVTNSFQVTGILKNVYEIITGNINKTFVSIWDQFGEERKYIHQKINTELFKNPFLLIENIHLIVTHIKTYYPEENFLELVKVKGSDNYLCIDNTGIGYWRTYKYIEEGVVFNFCENPEIAFKAAFKAGCFLKMLSNLDVAKLKPVLSEFQNLSLRVEQFKKALFNDTLGRVKELSKEIELVNHFIQELLNFDELKNTKSRKIITHSDLKITNIIFHETTLQPLCVIDLDTCMEGSLLYDFGDMVRSLCVTGKEDEDIDKVEFKITYFEESVKGFFAGYSYEVNETDKRLLYKAPAMITLTIGIRFLTDYIEGDHYFNSYYPKQNLLKAINMFHIFNSMRSQENEMKQIIDKFLI